MKNEDFTIFVSYAHEDKKLVELACQKLSSAGLSIWIDKKIHHGESISSRIVKAIERARFVLFFSSKYSNKSDYCIGEVLVAVQKKKCIIPIKIAPTDYCDDLLVHLIRLHYVNFIDGFLQDEYNELVSVLSGYFSSDIIDTGAEYAEEQCDDKLKKRFQGTVLLMFAIILILLGVLIWKKYPQFLSLDHTKIKAPVVDLEEIKEYSRAEHKEIFPNPGYELPTKSHNFNHDSNLKKITIIVKKSLAHFFEEDISKYQNVVIAPNYNHEADIVTFYCEGDSWTISQIIHQATKDHHDIVVR